MVLFIHNKVSPTALNAKKPTSPEYQIGDDSPAGTEDGSSVALETRDDLCGSLLKEAVELPSTVIERPAKTITKEAFDALIRDISITYSCSPAAGLVGLFSTLQAGGTNKNKRSNVKITVAGCSFESKKVNELIAKHCKEFTPRQFAVYFRNDIFKLSKIHDITGNAYVSLRRNYPDVITDTNQVEKYWASDFQIDNPACPPLIRQGLRQRYNEKFMTRRN